MSIRILQKINGRGDSGSYKGEIMKGFSDSFEYNYLILAFCKNSCSSILLYDMYLHEEFC